MKKIVLIISGIYAFINVYNQTDTMFISFDDAARIANDSSLQTFRSRNLYLAAYWQFNNYKAQKLPQLNFSTTPISFNRTINKQYSFNDSGYVYVPEQTLNSTAGLSARQNLTLTGGSIYVNSDLRRLENRGSHSGVQFSSTWLSVGYQQPIFGYNSFKWEKKTKPLAYEAAQREYIESRESITIKLIPLFFGLADSEMALQIAEQNYYNTDTLYKISEERFKLTSVNKADLLTLRLELINAENSLKQARNNYNRAKDNLLIFLRIAGENIKIILPDKLPDLHIEPSVALSHSKQNYPLYIKLKHELLEAEQYVQKTKIESRFNASLNANFGLNKNAIELSDVYIDPLDKQMASVSLNVPILDWGVRKSRYNIAKNELEAKVISVEQNKIDFEQEMLRLVNEFNLQKEIVNSSKEAANIAIESYGINKERYLLGRIDINLLSLQQAKKDQALRNYINELRKYWLFYYQIRQLTLYDFMKGVSLIETFESSLFDP